MAEEVRVGRVSSVDYENGTCEVIYQAHGQSVTGRANVVSNGTYRMPQVGEQVCVLHQGGGHGAVVSVGTIWNRANPPIEGKKGLYRRELGERNGIAFERYDSEKEQYTLTVGGTTFSVHKTGQVTLTVAQTVLTIEPSGAVVLRCKEISVQADEIKAVADGGISLVGKEESIHL